MKKNIFLLALGLTFATMAHAETIIEWTKAGCQSVGGTWITAHNASDEGCDAAHCNSLNFCQSPQKMNFFSALIWCKSIGRNMVSFANLCPGIPSGWNSATGACANAKGIDSTTVWTTLPVDASHSYYVILSSGAVGSPSSQTNSSHSRRDYASESRALCE